MSLINQTLFLYTSSVDRIYLHDSVKCCLESNLCSHFDILLLLWARHVLQINVIPNLLNQVSIKKKEIMKRWNLQQWVVNDFWLCWLSRGTDQTSIGCWEVCIIGFDITNVVSVFYYLHKRSTLELPISHWVHVNYLHSLVAMTD